MENVKTEQLADDEKRKYRTVSLDTADDKMKEPENSIAGLESSVAKAKDALAVTKEEGKALEDAIKALDKMVAETNSDYMELMAEDSAASEGVLCAKNRLNNLKQMARHHGASHPVRGISR